MIGIPFGAIFAQVTASTTVETQITVSVGDFLFCWGRTENNVAGTPPTMTVSDQTHSETFTQIGSQFNLTDEGALALFVLKVATAGVKTIRITNSESSRKFIGLHVNTARGFNADQTNSGSNAAGSTSWDSGAASTTVAIEYLLGCAMDTFTASPTKDAAWTELHNTGGTRPVTQVQYRKVTAKGSYNNVGTWSVSVGWLAAIATLFEMQPDANRARMAIQQRVA